MTSIRVLPSREITAANPPLVVARVTESLTTQFDGDIVAGVGYER